MRISETRKGEIIVLGNAALWGFFPVVTILTYASLPPLLSLWGSIFFAMLTFGIILTWQKKWKAVKSPALWRDIFMGTFFSGFLYYIFTYWGLTRTSAGNAILIAQTETLFSFLFFHLWRKEEFSWINILGAFFMTIGAVIVLLPKGTPLNGGDFLVLLAAAVAPFGSYFQRKARRQVDSFVIMFWRSLMLLPIVGFTILIFKEHLAAIPLGYTLIFVAINGILLFGFSKVLWLESIHRISVAKANALGSFSPLITLIFAYLILRQIPKYWQLLALAPMVAGIYLLTLSDKNASKVLA